MKTNENIVAASAAYVNDYFSKNLNPAFLYHNFSHTAQVAKAVSTLCTAMRINRHQKKLLLIAAWFHDLGFTRQIDDHEKEGARLAEEFLRANEMEEEDIETVKSCIQATSYPQKPTTLLQQIICDADLMYLGGKDFIKISNLLRKEWELTRSITYTDIEWYWSSIRFASAHHFHTPYCAVKVERGKNKNIRLLLHKLRPEPNQASRYEKEVFMYRPERGVKGRLKRRVEAFFRAAAGKHLFGGIAAR